jgi:hypothetical protein
MSKRGDAKHANKRARQKANKAAAKPERDKIPRKIKLAVRQRCGFGCVMCGAPVYHYEHMEDWAIVLKHEEENITLLCPNSHEDKTNKLLPLQKLQEANADPFNLQAGHSTPRFYYFGDERPTISIGDVGFTHPERDFAAIVIDGVPIVGFRFDDDGQALLQLRLYDAQNNLLLQVVDGELVYRVDIWDIEFVGNVLTVRQKERDILLKIKLDPNKNLVEIDRGTLYYNEIEIEVWPDTLTVLNTENTFSGFSVEAPIGLIIGKIPKRLENVGLLHVPAEQREFDRVEAKKRLAAYRKELPASKAAMMAADELRAAAEASSPSASGAE